MKFKPLILLAITFLILCSCNDPVKFENSGDHNNTEAETGALGGKCYPNQTCDKGLICDEESGTCMKDPEAQGDTGTPVDSDNIQPGDTGDPAADSGDSNPPDSGDTNPTDTGNIEPTDTGSVEPTDTGDSAPDEDSEDIDPRYECTPGKKQTCEYQGPAGTENVGQCKAAVRTCKDDKTWGHCEGEVLPVYESGEELCTNGLDDDCDGEEDNKNGSCSYFWQDPGLPDEDTENPGIIDVGYTGEYHEAYEVPDDESGSETCSDTCVPIQAECFPAIENEYEAGLCNGLDDDCDGEVDEGCPCTPGQTQRCFLGPRNYRGVGTCRDGVQTCIVNLKGGKAITGRWGACKGGISPQQDVCDFADNNCNGCSDDLLCCAPPINCAYDIGTALPFSDKIIDGSQIYDAEHRFNDADTATWEWTLSKGPCDIVLDKTSFAVKGANNETDLAGTGSNTTTASGVGMKFFKVNFTLSGSYRLHLKVTRGNGEVYECEWILRVVSQGFRVELCWDTTGNQGVDLDLHLAKVDTTTSWKNNTACFYQNCKGDPTASSGGSSGGSAYNWNLSGWAYPTTGNYNRDGVWVSNLKNPRLDIDNIQSPGIPENINLDNPLDTDTFRIGVNYFSGNLLTHPVVNVYCGGTLKATFGVDPQVSNFNGKNKLWKVAEVQWVGDPSSDACVITPKFDEVTGYVLGTVDTYEW